MTEFIDFDELLEQFPELANIQPAITVDVGALLDDGDMALPPAERAVVLKVKIEAIDGHCVLIAHTDEAAALVNEMRELAGLPSNVIAESTRVA